MIEDYLLSTYYVLAMGLNTSDGPYNLILTIILTRRSHQQHLKK